MRALLAAVSCLPLCAVACSPANTKAERGGASPRAAAEAPRPLPSPLPDVVARVNGQALRLAQILPMAVARIKRVSPGSQEQRKAESMRQALAEYVERELLLQEALARGTSADARSVERAYDQMRRGHADEADWASYLATQGTDPQQLKAELRVQQTVAALVEREAAARGVSPDEARKALLETLRAKARVELFL